MSNYQPWLRGVATALVFAAACAHGPEIPRADFEVVAPLAKEHYDRAQAYFHGPPGETIARIVIQHIAKCKIEAFLNQPSELPESGTVELRSTDLDIVLGLNSAGGIASFSAKPADAEADCVAEKLRGASFAPPPFSPLYMRVRTSPPP